MKNIIKTASIFLLTLMLLNCEGGKDIPSSDINLTPVFSLGNVITTEINGTDVLSFEKVIDIYQDEPLVIEFDGEFLEDYSITEFVNNSSADIYLFNGTAFSSNTKITEDLSENITIKKTTEIEIVFSYDNATSNTEIVNGIEAIIDGDFSFIKTTTVTTEVIDSNGDSTIDTAVDTNTTTSVLDILRTEKFI